MKSSSDAKRRVVVTGIGAVTPLGNNVNDTWNNIIEAKSGITKIEQFDTERFSSKIAGSIKNFNPEEFVEIKDIKKMDIFIQYGMGAAHEAILDSGIIDLSDQIKENIGVMVGSGIGGLRNIENYAIELLQNGRVNPFFIPSTLINLLSGHISIKYGFRGPNHSVVTACSTGAHAIGDASRMIKYGDADIVIAGSAESGVTPLGVAGFCACRALSTNFNDMPEKASRPWDKNRDGFVISEGAAILVLEEYNHAVKRNAKIYGEISGYGMSGDAYHITSPHPDGLGALNAMKRALKDGGVNDTDIDYINAHGTSTLMGDKIELLAVQQLFENNKKLLMSSTKSSVGHLLGAAGSLEAILCLLAIKNQIAPATLNLDDPIDEVKIDLVPNTPKATSIKTILTNSFGFGGTNVSLVINKV